VAASEVAITITVGGSFSDVHLIDLVERVRSPPTISRPHERSSAFDPPGVLILDSPTFSHWADAPVYPASASPPSVGRACSPHTQAAVSHWPSVHGYEPERTFLNSSTTAPRSIAFGYNPAL
jgi:hypothetical protein